MVDMEGKRIPLFCSTVTKTPVTMVYVAFLLTGIEKFIRQRGE